MANESEGKPKFLLSARETAYMLNISVRKLQNITAPNGTLPVVRINRRIGYRPQAVEAWLIEQEKSSEGKSKE